MSGTRKQAEKMEAVLRELDGFCAECDHVWACEGCPIDKAKRKMVWLSLESRIKVLGEALTPDEKKNIDQPSRHLTLIQGGKRGR